MENNIIPAKLTGKLNSVNPINIIAAGWEGTKRNLKYIQVHRGPGHPYAAIFGPLGGLLIPDEDLQPRKIETSGSLLPTAPQDGPPLPQRLGIKWLWKKP